MDGLDLPINSLGLLHEGGFGPDLNIAQNIAKNHFPDAHKSCRTFFQP